MGDGLAGLRQEEKTRHGPEGWGQDSVPEIRRILISDYPLHSCHRPDSLNYFVGSDEDAFSPGKPLSGRASLPVYMETNPTGLSVAD